MSYSHKDEDFVMNELVQNLESGHRPLRLCLHYRDWLAGEWISEQIIKSINESRHTIVVLSENYLESVWGKMEFRIAHKQAMSRKSAKVIIVVYANILEKKNLGQELESYLSMHTYEKWGDPWFWEKLRYTLHHNKKQNLNLHTENDTKQQTN